MSDLFGKFTKSVLADKTSKPKPVQPDTKSASNALPELPLCETVIRGVIDGNLRGLSALCIMRELGNHSGESYLRDRLKKATIPEVKLFKAKRTHDWVPPIKTWQAVLSDQTDKVEWFVPADQLRPFVEWTQLHARQDQAVKVQRFRKFNIELAPEEVECIKVPIEIHLIDKLERMCPHKIERQYRIGKYRVDAYIPALKMVIQIDENGHSKYDQNDEKDMNDVMRSQNMVCLRFNPDQQYNGLPEEELVRIVWERTLSPDFTIFRDKFKLV